MICPDCGIEPFVSGPHGELDCICGPEEPPRSRYTNHCHYCADGWVDSWDPNCKKSAIPDMGYHCVKCGEDLRKWKLKHYLLPLDAVQRMEYYYEGQITSLSLPIAMMI